MSLSKADLRREVFRSLRRQGFLVGEDGLRIVSRKGDPKDHFRALQATAVEHIRRRRGRSLARHEPELLSHIAAGDEVDPRAIRPRLVPVARNSVDELLFRYVGAHWSVPVSAGYGRRLRFLVRDRSNGKVMGIIGLCDPVAALGARDDWIGWDPGIRRERLWHVMEAYLLGAVPPYSDLLCGKFMAMLLCCEEIGLAFRKTYSGTRGRISGKLREGDLALITTASALGRSSVYNRLKVGGVWYLRPIGYTLGTGDFQFCNGTYRSLLELVREHGSPSAKHAEWGAGVRNRREVVIQALRLLDLDPRRFMTHGIRREIFAAERGRETLRYLRGEISRLCRRGETVDSIFGIFRERWLLPRAERRPEFRDFRREEYVLWGRNGDAG